MAEKDTSKIWLTLSTTAEIALAITLNKYSAKIPNWVILIIWIVPLILFILWILTEEKSKKFIQNFRDTPISYVLMLLLFGASLGFATQIVRIKIFEPSKTSSAAPPISTSHNSGSTPVFPTQNDGLKPNQAPQGARGSTKPVASHSGTNSQMQPTTLPGMVVNAPDNQGNVAGINYGVQNQYGVPEPPPESEFLQRPLAPNEEPGPGYEGFAVVGDKKLGNPGVFAKIRVKSTFKNPIFLFECSHPCILTAAATNGMVTYTVVSFGETPKTTGVLFTAPSIIPSGGYAEVVLRSLDSTPITVLRAYPYAEPARDR